MKTLKFLVTVADLPLGARETRVMNAICTTVTDKLRTAYGPQVQVTVQYAEDAPTKAGEDARPTVPEEKTSEVAA